MNVALWSAQVLLALLFLFSAVIKGTQSKQGIIEIGQTGVANYSLSVIRFVAGCELLAVVGLIGPQATGIARILTPLAATGLVIIMFFAARAHLALKEPRTAAGNIVIAGVCVFVAAGRYLTN